MSKGLDDVSPFKIFHASPMVSAVGFEQIANMLRPDFWRGLESSSTPSANSCTTSFRMFVRKALAAPSARPKREPHHGADDKSRLRRMHQPRCFAKDMLTAPTMASAANIAIHSIIPGAVQITTDRSRLASHKAIIAAAPRIACARPKATSSKGGCACQDISAEPGGDEDRAIDLGVKDIDQMNGWHAVALRCARSEHVSAAIVKRPPLVSRG
jgi:hypothetical protein